MFIIINNNKNDMTREQNKEYDKLKNNIIKYNNTLWLPDNKIKYDSNNLNTWFDFDISKANSINNKPNIKNNHVNKIKIEATYLYL